MLASLGLALLTLGAGAAAAHAASPLTLGARPPRPIVNIAETSAQPAGPDQVTQALQQGDPGRAAAALAQLRTTGEAPAQLATLDGRVKFANLDFSGALAAFAEAQRLDPKAAEPRVQAARVLMLQGKQAEAEQTLAAAVKALPWNDDALSAYVAILLARGEQSAAVGALRSAHAARPGDAGRAVNLSDLLAGAGQGAQAVTVLDETDKAAAGLPQADRDSLTAARVRALIATGKRPEAIAAARQLVAARPDDVAARSQLVRLLLAGGDTQGAKTVIEDGLSRDPHNPSLLFGQVVVAARTGGMQAGLDEADRLAADSANGTPAKLLKGQLLMTQRRYFDAAAAYASYMGPHAPEIIPVRTAQALAADNRAGDAKHLLRDWLGGNPGGANAAMLLATLDLKDGDKTEAAQLLDGVAAQEPDNAAALADLAGLEQERQQLPPARSHALRAWLLAPSPGTTATLGWIVLQDGEAAAAVDLLRLAAGAPDANPLLRLHYALALKQSGQTDAAKAILMQLAGEPASGAAKAQAQQALDSMTKP